MKTLSAPYSWILLAITLSAFQIHAAEKHPLIYRMSQLEEVKKRAIAENKPIAWIGTATKYLAPYTKDINGKSSHAATAYAIRALQRDAILIYSDAETENHQEPQIVDQALHSPEAHYRVPGVIILTPNLDKVIGKTFREEDPRVRAKEFLELQRKIRDKASWQEKKPDK